MKQRSRLNQWLLDFDHKHQRGIEALTFAFVIITVISAVFQWMK